MYSSWATKQRAKIYLIVGGIGFSVFAAYILIGLYQPPTCFDGKKNQDELNADCGGVCSLMCPSQITPLNLVWVRSFEVMQGIWSAFAYIENPNPQAEVHEVGYKFSLFDKNNALITEKEGTTYITQDTLLPVFMGRMDVGDAVPYRTTFEWTQPLVWYRTKELFDISLIEQDLKNTQTQPELRALLINNEPFPLRDVEVYAIVYDAEDNAIAVSKTAIDLVSGRGRSNVVFTWQKPFDVQPKRWQLIPRVPKQD